LGRTSDTREKLLEAACRLFHQRGYQSVSVQELCDDADVKKGSFYHFFRSKQELALAMIERQWESVRKREFEPVFTSDLPPLRRIEVFFRNLRGDLDHARNEGGAVCGCPFGNLAVEMAAQDSKLRHKISAVYGEWADFFEQALREAESRGEIAVRDARGLAESLVAMTSGIALLAKVQNDAAVADRVADQVMVVLGGRRTADAASISS